jgi:hypothetical protein
MRGRKFILVACLVAATALPEAATAQFSPGGIVGAVTHPLRSLLGRLGHFPRRHRSAATPESEPPATPQARARHGAVGPAAWPTAFEDVVGYTFWPGKYAETIRTRGFDVIADTIAGTSRGAEPARSATTGAAARSDAPTADMRKACKDDAAAVDDGLVARIERTVQPIDAQRNAFGQLRTALAQAVKTIKAGCRDATALSPVNRLDLAVQQLWAVRDGGIYVRAPLKDVYGGLTPAQKTALEWKQRQERPRPGAAANATMGGQYQACAAQSNTGSERLIGQIEQTVRPNKEQSASLEGLRKTATDMAKLLTLACVQPIPADPIARLDAADDQLSSMSYAATSMQIALNEFYSRLNNEQKAKFNSLGQ